MYGLSDEEIAAIRGGQFAGFAAPDAALLRMADAMSDTPSNINDDLTPNCARIFPKNNSWNSLPTRRWKTIAHALTGCSMWVVMACIERGCGSNNARWHRLVGAHATSWKPPRDETLLSSAAHAVNGRHWRANGLRSESL